MSLNSLRSVVQRSRWAPLWVLVLALLTAQTLGLVHAVVHGAMHPTSLGAHSSQGDCADSDGPHESLGAQDAGHHGGDRDAFGHDAGSAECRLFDGVGHDWATAGSGAQLPAIAPGLVASATPVSQTAAAPLLGYRARAPPRPGLAAA